MEGEGTISWMQDGGHVIDLKSQSQLIKDVGDKTATTWGVCWILNDKFFLFKKETKD